MAARKRILAIDDEASVCDMYEQGLPPLGYDVTCCSSAKKAKESLAKSLPDLILMDIMMPDQDGISLTRDIRSEERTSQIPIVVVSGLSDAATLNDALLFGAVDYLVKPFDVEVLQGKIERALALAERKKKT
ncbi:MAG: response regulator [Elusimicrobia bacterium]|nr:response regulator [Elusimicrobiota bacterium]